MMTEEKIKLLLDQGESKTIEFKVKTPDSLELARILSAFANTEGGYLVIGVDENKKIVGLNKSEIAEGIKIISKVVDSHFEYEVPIHSTKYDTHDIIVVEVPKNLKGNLPLILANGKMFIRDNMHTKAAVARIMSRNLAHNIGSHILNYSPSKSSISNKSTNLIVSDSIRIFVAMSFREEEEPALVDYYRAMERAVKESNLPIIITRMDRIEGDYEISQQIMEEIDKADLIIADFTLSSQNVYFELGYARGRLKRVIQTSRKNTKLEFDTRNWKTIIYRNATELEVKIKPAIEVAYMQIIKERHSE